MPFEFRLQRRVEFSETDAAGIVHFSNFFRYMEAVEHAFFRSLGLSIASSHENPPVGFPRVHADCDYRRPLRFEDILELHLLVQEKRTRSIRYQIRFRRIEPGPAEPVALGHCVVACVRRDETGRMTATPLPPGLDQLLETAPPQLFESPWV